MERIWTLNDLERFCHRQGKHAYDADALRFLNIKVAQVAPYRLIGDREAEGVIVLERVVRWGNEEHVRQICRVEEGPDAGATLVDRYPAEGIKFSLVREVVPATREWRIQLVMSDGSSGTILPLTTNRKGADAIFWALTNVDKW